MSAGVTPLPGRVCPLTDIISNFAEKDEEEEEESGPASHGPSYDRPTCDTTGINV